MKRLSVGILCGIAVIVLLGTTAYRERFGQLVVGVLQIDDHFIVRGEERVVWREYDLTSPTVTFNVAGARWIDVSTTPSQTGAYPTGGTLNQIITIRGSGITANTLRFDDGTTTNLTGNLSIGDGDYLTLRCTSSTADRWEEISASNN